MCSIARVMRVVAMDRAMVAATIAVTAHSGKCAAAVVAGGGSGGARPPPGGGSRIADAAGARPIAAVRKTASPLRVVRVRRVDGMPRAARGGGDACEWFMGIAPSATWAGACWGGVWICPYRHISAGRPAVPWGRLGTAAWNSGGPGGGPVVE